MLLDISPLKHRDFRFLYIGQLVSGFGSMMTYVALPYQLYQLTGSSLAVGMVGIVQLVPLLLTAFIGGAYADVLDRRKLVMSAELGLALCSSVLALNAWSAHPHIWPIYLVAGLASALGGILIAVAGLGATYLVDVLSFGLSLTALCLVRHMHAAEEAASPSLSSIVEGLKYAKSRQELIGTYVVDIVAVVFGMPMALFPAVAAGFGGAKVVGLLYSAPFIGAFVVAASSAWTGRVHRHGAAIVVAAAAWGAAIVAFGFCTHLWPALFFLALAGGADAVSGIFRTTLWNTTIPDRLRGRLAGVEMASFMTGPLLGNAESGLVAALVGTQLSILSGGVLCVAGVCVCALCLPRFWAYDYRRWLESQPEAKSSAPRDADQAFDAGT